MELRHLRYFVAVADTLNFRMAAARLRISQPSLSHQIKVLENELGVRLFCRDTASVSLSDSGAVLLPKARKLLADAKLAEECVREAERGERGTVKVGYSGPILMGFMPVSMRAFNERYPDVEVLLSEIPMMDQLAALESGGIQLGFWVAGIVPRPRTIRSARVFRSPLVVAMRRDHPLSSHPRISLSDVAKETVLCFLPRPGAMPVHSMIVRRAFESRHIPVPKLRQIDGGEALRAMIESGAGISLVSDMGNLSGVRDLALRPLKEKGDDLIIELEVLWDPQRVTAAATNMMKVIRETASSVLHKPGRVAPSELAAVAGR